MKSEQEIINKVLTLKESHYDLMKLLDSVEGLEGVKEIARAIFGEKIALAEWILDAPPVEILDCCDCVNAQNNNYDEPCASCVSYNNHRKKNDTVVKEKDVVKCSNCIHKEVMVIEEPCVSCTNFQYFMNKYKPLTPPEK